jgi:hypothetical protein
MPVLTSDANPGTSSWATTLDDVTNVQSADASPSLDLTVHTGDAAAGASGNVDIQPGTSSTEANRGHVPLMGLRHVSAQATNIAAVRTMSLADSGGIFDITQSSAFAITLPAAAVGNAGVRYTFFISTIGAFAVTVSDGGANLEGTIVLDASVIPATGTTLTFINGAVIGDNIEVFSTGVNWMVRAVSSAAGGITIT